MDNALLVANVAQLLSTCLVLVLLTFAVALRMLWSRAREARAKRLHPQKLATSGQMAAHMEDTRAADNFRNLFEVPVLFYALASLAVALGHVPAWLVTGAWLFVLSRIAHSLIHCSYNRVLHRFIAFGGGFLLLVLMWLGYVADLTSALAA
ncbi:MAPEG family protein [Alkalilimnicola sp. S0819]|uniref:MAPEG family protein n=1 Tax=Alkalilimnicola sp. S0819 TaxID=2613922 RepID=UPI00126170DD|nr:MAPEG family protein [Alkalilimnicola sp. S0819]KAB7622686.1 hypothetical protein F3N43_11835 [Alkalilimnicola sp. S0819]MPQ17324.1 hypothetical protein [Alkalilimnicola sp. S0819]